jgi:CheY-like chemotaxis protein
MASATSPRAVIVADADTEHRKRVVEIVQRVGERIGQKLEVHEAADGQGVEELIDEKDPVLVVTEVLLDHISGLALLRKLRNAEDGDARLWVFVTNMNHESDKYWALRNGVDAYVMRPYQDESLEKRLAKLLTGEVETGGLDRLD